MPRPDAVHPVGATVLATRSRPHHRLRRQLPAVAALAVGVGLTLVLYALLSVRERDRQRRAFERRTAEIAGAVEKVLDFGLVKQLEADGSDVSRPEWVVGTPLYMAPESIRSPDRIGPRSDLYALGAVGYFLVTGTQVFTGRNMVEVCGHHLHTEPVPPSRRATVAIPPALERVILACLAKDPGARPASARELLEALEAVDSEPWTQEAAREWWERHERRRFEAARRAAAAHSPDPGRPPAL